MEDVKIVHLLLFTPFTVTYTSLNDRMIGIGYDDLERCKNVVCVAYGEAKAAAVAGALRGGFINTLIIDSACGEKLL